MEARKSMEKRTNKLLAERWIKLLVAIYKDDKESIQKLNENKITEEEAEQILNNQLKLIHLRLPNFKHITLE